MIIARWLTPRLPIPLTHDRMICPEGQWPLLLFNYQAKGSETSCASRGGERGALCFGALLVIPTSHSQLTTNHTRHTPLSCPKQRTCNGREPEYMVHAQDMHMRAA